MSQGRKKGADALKCLNTFTFWSFVGSLRFRPFVGHVEIVAISYTIAILIFFSCQYSTQRNTVSWQWLRIWTIFGNIWQYLATTATSREAGNVLQSLWKQMCKWTNVQMGFWLKGFHVFVFNRQFCKELQMRTVLVSIHFRC